MTRLFLIVLFAMWLPHSSYACVGGKTAPVVVQFTGTGVDLVEAAEKKGKRIIRGILVADVQPTQTRGNESRALRITLAKGSERMDFRLAYPPLARSGCNQPYLYPID